MLPKRVHRFPQCGALFLFAEHFQDVVAGQFVLTHAEPQLPAMNAPKGQSVQKHLPSLRNLFYRGSFLSTLN